jgi:DNA adenine methylase
MLSYIGGKSKISSFIVPEIPKDIETYAEVFGGMFWTYFNMDIDQYPNLKRIVYNDKNPVNSNLFKCVKDTDNFYNYIKDVPCQYKNISKEGQKSNPLYEELFYKFQKNAFKDEPFGEEPDFERGMNYAYVLSQVFSGLKPETGKFIDLKYKYRSKFDTFRDKVGGIGKGKKYKKMFERITDVETMDFEDFIKKYDNEKTFFYLDPPYYNTEKYYSNHDFNKDDHERLANVIKNIKGKFALSYYYFDDLEKWFPKTEFRWISKSFKKAASAKSGIKQNDGVELLIMNY